jgi:hypothetical protein
VHAPSLPSLTRLPNSSLPLCISFHAPHFAVAPTVCRRLSAFVCRSNASTELRCDVLLNATYPHVYPLYISVLDNALLRYRTGNPNALIEVSDSPLPLTVQEEVWRMSLRCLCATTTGCGSTRRGAALCCAVLCCAPLLQPVSPRPPGALVVVFFLCHPATSLALAEGTFQWPAARGCVLRHGGHHVVVVRGVGGVHGRAGA